MSGRDAAVLEMLPLAGMSLKLRRERAVRVRESGPGLADWIPLVSRQYETPRHLARLVELLERSEREPVRAVVSAPPRHGKTSTIQHAIGYRLQRRPADTIGYASYSAPLARSKSRDARDLAERAGVTLREDAKSASEWRTPEGGGLLAAGVGGGWTGFGFNLFLIDDPLKNRADAESAIVRESLWSWFQSTAYTRLEPGASAVVVATRWHEDDLPGRLIRDGWEEINLPAMDEVGHALWPERWPESELAKIRDQIGDYDWSSLYQGRPRPRGGAVFRDAYYYDDLPTDGYRQAIGIDLAYTARTHADWSVAILGRAVGVGTEARVYVEDVLRYQVEAPRFAAALQALQENTGAPIHVFAGGTEQGTVDFLARDYGLRIMTEPAKADKFVRAQPAAAAWNAGRILLPSRAPWMDRFLPVVLGFTGVNDLLDDDVDALASLWHGLSGSGVPAGASDDPEPSRRGRLVGAWGRRGYGAEMEE